jgi:hypothetical protein
MPTKNTPENGRAEIHVSANREIDARDQQHKGHADSDDGDVAGLIDDVKKIDGCQKPVRHEPEHDD